jgi:uncharacterized DUF497 family protein
LWIKAQALWLDEALLEGRGRGVDEARSMMIGRIDEERWSAVITHRGASVRLVSVRRARPKDVAGYERR